MRYSPILYAKSLFEILEGSKPSVHDSILKNFWQTVEKYGDSSRRNAILDSFENLVVRSNGGRIVDIETAREIPSREMTKLVGLFGGKDLIKRSINPKLVAGLRVEFNGEVELDYSLVRKFRKMFTAKI